MMVIGMIVEVCLIWNREPFELPLSAFGLVITEARGCSNGGTIRSISA